MMTKGLKILSSTHLHGVWQLLKMSLLIKIFFKHKTLDLNQKLQIYRTVKTSWRKLKLPQHYKTVQILLTLLVTQNLTWTSILTQNHGKI